jgi:16S rRNA (guanine966-N2)-methyltransferase
VRVIAGKFRSRPLHSLRGLDIRPTSDRLRETLFNVLTAGNPHALESSVWLDLFAGTGAVGIEALSRGAEMVYFVDCAKPAAELVRQNLQALGISEGFQILPQESVHAISQLERQQIKPDYIFLDPPYRLSEAYQKTLEILGSSNLSESALVIAEHEKRFDLGERFGNLQRSRTLQQGDAGLSFYRRVPDQNLQPPRRRARRENYLQILGDLGVLGGECL